MDIKKEKTEYDEICDFEAMSVNQRFLPYAVGSPSKDVTYDNQYKRANFIFFSDSHIDFSNPDESFDNVVRTIEFANNSKVEFDAIIHAGDAITPFGVRNKTLQIANATRFFDVVKKSRSPFIFAKGNHDINDWGNKPENVLTDKDWSDLFYDFAEKEYGIVRQNKKNGEKSTWHYYDDESNKIRIVCVDVQDTDKTKTNENGTVKYYGGCSWYITEEQMNWIITKALRFDEKSEKDWGVIFTFHQYASNRSEHQNAVDRLLDVCVAFNNQSVYCNDYVSSENPFFNMKIEADFTRYSHEERKPHIICWLLGHIHEDKHIVKNGINIIYTLNNSASTVCGDARVARILGTATQNSFDILNIDTTHRKIRIFKYGAGMNCYGVGGDRFLPDGLSY